MISWNTENGDCNVEDWFNRLLLTFLESSCYPDIDASFDIIIILFKKKRLSINYYHLQHFDFEKMSFLLIMQ